MEIFSFAILTLIPPLMSGPLPAAIWFRTGLSQNWRQRLPLAALSAIVLNLGASALIVFNLDGLLPPGFFACALTPISALATLLVSRVFVQRADPDPARRRWLQVGVFAIPVLQLLTITALVLMAPALCSLGIRSCPE